MITVKFVDYIWNAYICPLLFRRRTTPQIPESKFYKHSLRDYYHMNFWNSNLFHCLSLHRERLPGLQGVWWLGSIKREKMKNLALKVTSRLTTVNFVWKLRSNVTSVKSNVGGGDGAPEQITWGLWLLKWSLHKSTHTSYLNRIGNIYRQRSNISAESNHSHMLYANHPNMSNIYPLCGWLIWAVAIWIKMLVRTGWGQLT